jgi:hypothetical protein
MSTDDNYHSIQSSQQQQQPSQCKEKCKSIFSISVAIVFILFFSTLVVFFIIALPLVVVEARIVSKFESDPTHVGINYEFIHSYTINITVDDYFYTHHFVGDSFQIQTSLLFPTKSEIFDIRNRIIPTLFMSILVYMLIVIGLCFILKSLCASHIREFSTTNPGTVDLDNLHNEL